MYKCVRDPWFTHKILFSFQVLVNSYPNVRIVRAELNALLTSDKKPALLTRRLLAAFFDDNTLATSSALGTRKAHNSKTATIKVLDTDIIGAIKRKYVLDTEGN